MLEQNISVEIRYPGDHEPVDSDDYLKAVEIAENVLKWIEKKMSK